MAAKINWARMAAALLVLLIGLAARASANVAVLLEEPYSYDGALAGTGHAAVYLTRVCAESPVKLRLCEPSERGAVISRYHRVAGYDWIAIPLVPYLYAVEDPDQAPLFADHKLVAFLRDRYRRDHLEAFAPDGPDGDAPKGDWYELVGSSYDRTNYGFEIETTREQDEAFIDWMNSRPNRDKYNFVSSNCADFVREVLNFYYPKSESHGNLADLFVSTPKHAAKSLVRYSHRHGDLEFTRFVIPQVPGTMKRSRRIHGVLESAVRAKYLVALAVFHPFIAGGVASVYLVGNRFNPAHDAEVFSLSGPPEPAPSGAEKREYRGKLETIRIPTEEISGGIGWKDFLSEATPGLDREGEARLEATDGSTMAQVGVTLEGLEPDSASLDLQESLMLARMKQELGRSWAPRTSSAGLRQDWLLLKKIDSARREQLTGAPDEAVRGSSETVPRASN